MSRIYQDTVGLPIEIDMGESLAEATDYVFLVRKPRTTQIVEWAPTINGEKFVYTTQAGDLDLAGLYVFQPSFTLGEWTGRGSPVALFVSRGLA